MSRFIEGMHREQATLFPERIEGDRKACVSPKHPVEVILLWISK